MFKKQFIIPVLIIAVAAAFVLVSFLVFLTRGRPSLIRKKLKIGAVLIALTGMISCDLVDGKDPPTCYVPLPIPNNFYVTDPVPDRTGIDMDLSTGNVLKGVIHNREGADFSFRVEDGDGAEMQRADILALDGEYDEFSEEFEIEIREDLSTGTYILGFYDIKASDQPSSLSGMYDFKLNITNESPVH